MALPFNITAKSGNNRRGGGLRAPFADEGRGIKPGIGWYLILPLVFFFLSPPPLSITAGEKKPLRFGQKGIFQKCIHITVVSYRNNQSDLDNNDWVSISLENHCDAPLMNLEVALVLVDKLGRAYGTRLWLLGRKQILRPERVIIEKYPIPDPDHRIAIGWGMRVIRVDKPKLKKRRGSR